MALLSEEDLKAWTGYSRTSDVESFLVKNRIVYFHAKGGRVCTTSEAIANRVNTDQTQKSDFDF